MIQITQRGVEIPNTVRDMVTKARDELTVAPLPTHANPRPFRFQAYVDLPDRIIVPKYWALSRFPDILRDARDTRKDARNDEDRMMTHAFCGNLRTELDQPKAVKATLESLHTHGGGVLSLAVGHGKTCCALYIACELRAKTLIIVHKKFLADQWQDRIKHFVPSATISFIQGDVCDTSGDFVIAMIQTLLSRTYPPHVFSGCSLLIFDEAHHVAAKVFCNVMFSLNLPYTLGLTATPSRKDGLERLIHHFLGPSAYEKSLEVRHDVVVNSIKYTCGAYASAQPLNGRGDIDYAKVLTLIANDMERTNYIADILHRDLQGKDVLVLSHRRAHCNDLVNALRVRGLDADVYIGGVKKIPTSKIIVSSYAYVSEGFDEPRLEVLVLATPASDVAQTMGRILRGNDATKKPVIVDIVDTWGVCFAQAAKRRKQYTAAGFRINQR